MTDLTAEVEALKSVIGKLGFYDDNDVRIELEMPFPYPLAKHLAERGVRYRPELAVVKPSRNARGEQVWVPLDAPDPEPEPMEGDPQQLAALRAQLAGMVERIDAAIAADGGER